MKSTKLPLSTLGNNWKEDEIALAAEIHMFIKSHMDKIPMIGPMLKNFGMDIKMFDSAIKTLSEDIAHHLHSLK